MKLSHYFARHACALSAPMAVIVLTTGVAAPPVGHIAQHGPRPNAPAERIAPNDNRTPAGRLGNGVLTVRLEARNGAWYPDGEDGLAREVAAFAEEGGPLQNPGPLIRVPAGTEVRVTVRNSLERPLTMYGLGRIRGIAADSFRIDPGEAREMRFTAAEPGTYYYAGKATDVPVLCRREHGSQLNGVIVVDPPGAVQRHAMARLVLGIRVQPRGGTAAAPREARPIRGLVRSRPAAPGVQPRYAYVLGGSAAEMDPGVLPAPGPTLVLEKDQPVAITIVNQPHEPAAVHWHGIELGSWPDGVPGWSGSGDKVLPAIPPRDSLTVRFAPPRAGTFMYHSHFNEHHQITHGLYGAIAVLEPGQRCDPERDRVLLVSDEGPTINLEDGPFARPILNGQPDHAPIELRAGVTYRFRIINIRSDFVVALALLDGERPVEWRAVAKDGADLPASQAVTGPARLALGVGEIHDVEFTPRAPGELTLQLGFPPALRPDGTPVPRPAPTRVPEHVR